MMCVVNDQATVSAFDQSAVKELFTVIVGDPLERESFGKWKKTTTTKIAASSDNQGSRI